MRGAARGFTLVEILVVLGLLGMIAVLLAGGIGAGTRTWDRTRGKALGVEDMLGLQALLDVHLRQALPVRLAPGPDGGRRLAFSGWADGVAFVAPLPEGVARPGPGAVNLRLDRAAGRLILDWRPLALRSGLPAPDGPARRITVVENVEAAEFRYRGRAAEPWRGAWPPGPELPDLIEVTITPRGALPWPPLRVRPRLDGAIGPGAAEGD